MKNKDGSIGKGGWPKSEINRITKTTREMEKDLRGNKLSSDQKNLVSFMLEFNAKRIERMVEKILAKLNIKK